MLLQGRQYHCGFSVYVAPQKYTVLVRRLVKKFAERGSVCSCVINVTRDVKLITSVSGASLEGATTGLR